MIIEVCANSFESAKNAQDAGADRIELCSELGVGGITPSIGLIEKVTSELEIPVHVLIRPRSGHFNYSVTELDQMKRCIHWCKKMNCTGIVSGVLLPNLRIDLESTKALIAAAAPLPFIFHRAIDLVPNIEAAVSELVNIGVSGILSSGQKSTAFSGIELLTKLQYNTAKITIIPGGGITESNAHTFAHFKAVHFSGTIAHTENSQTMPMSFLSAAMLDENTTWVSDLKRLKAIQYKLRKR
jgi:copper homeostasis protein